MAFLTIAGVTVPVSISGAAEKQKETVGSDSRAYAGNLRSTVRAEKRNWQFTTKTLSTVDDAALVAAVAGGVFVTCAGDALGVSVTCRVTVTDGPYVKVAGGFRRTRVLQLREV
jgi:hypothetical protein